MKEFIAGQFDIAVIGAGHAGIEAALAAARLGLETVCFTINLDAVGNMPCNPAIGGTGKGHLVRELDALGGEMAKAADKACIQYRMLNRGKGPAVWSLRAQADRREYQKVMKHTLERQSHLTVRQGDATKEGPLRDAIDTGYDVVVANIVADVIISLAPQVRHFLKEDGWFLTSGIIDDRADEVAAALVAAGWSIVESCTSEGWYCYICR